MKILKGIIVVYVENCTQKHKKFKNHAQLYKWNKTFEKKEEADPQGTWTDHIIYGTVHFVK